MFSVQKKNSSKKKIEDETLSNFVYSKENCRRKTLILGMGGTGVLEPSERCCDMCTPSAVSADDRLNVLQVGKSVRRKRRVAVRVVNEELLKNLKCRLCVERDTFMQESPCLYMVGPDFVCPDVTIDELCAQAEYIETPDDITLFGIRPEMKDRLFKVITDVLSQLVHRKR